MNKKLLKRELEHCYSCQASHFSYTRKKERPELRYITEHIKSRNIHTRDEKCSIVELGCGTGRVLPLLEDIVGSKLWYIGNDIATGMLEQAAKERGGTIRESISLKTKKQRIVGDMVDALRQLPDNSVDYIISIASLQHIMTQEERYIVRSHMYRVLKYTGSILSVNRSYSSWFLKTYRRQQLATIGHCLLPPRHRKVNDIIIPRKDPQWEENQHIRRRYYHIFTLHELHELCLMSGFSINDIGYMSQDGVFNKRGRKNSRNSICIASKTIKA